MKKRLTIEDRILIEQLLKLNYKLKEIASILDCESSTVSREIKKRSFFPSFIVLLLLLYFLLFLNIKF